MHLAFAMPAAAEWIVIAVIGMAIIVAIGIAIGIARRRDGDRER